MYPALYSPATGLYYAIMRIAIHIFAPTYIGAAAAVRVTRVPRHPLKCINGCQAPFLRRMFGTKRPNFFKNSQILFI